MRRLRPVLPTLLALLLLPAAAPAQSCRAWSSVSAAAGYVSHRVAGGTPGLAVGGDVEVALPPVRVRAEYRRMMLDGDAADPDVVRLRAAFPVYRLPTVTFCGDVLAGATRFALADDAGAVLAGGLGISAVGVLGPVRPYLSVRGLGGWATGTVLGVPLDATGFALGVEGGLAVGLGPVTLRAAASSDGFDDGLGATPYPAASVELSLGVRF